MNLKDLLQKLDGEFDKEFKLLFEWGEGDTVKYEELKTHLHQRDRKIISAILEWAESTAGATGVDLRGRRWIDLQDLKQSLSSEI
jgi:propanediol dehydratase large subunit